MPAVLSLDRGFDSVDDLLQIARHESGDTMYLIRFHPCLQPRGTRQEGEMTRNGLACARTYNQESN